jgi:hypothetical protein
MSKQFSEAALRAQFLGSSSRSDCEEVSVQEAVNSRSEISARGSQCEVKTLRARQCVIIRESN